MAILVSERREAAGGGPARAWIDALYNEAYILASLARVGYQSLRDIAEIAFLLAVSSARSEALNNYRVRKARELLNEVGVRLLSDDMIQGEITKMVEGDLRSTPRDGDSAASKWTNNAFQRNMNGQSWPEAVRAEITEEDIARMKDGSSAVAVKSDSPDAQWLYILTHMILLPVEYLGTRISEWQSALNATFNGKVLLSKVAFRLRTTLKAYAAKLGTFRTVRDFFDWWDVCLEVWIATAVLRLAGEVPKEKVDTTDETLREVWIRAVEYFFVQGIPEKNGDTMATRGASRHLWLVFQMVARIAEVVNLSQALRDGKEGDIISSAATFNPNTIIISQLNSLGATHFANTATRTGSLLSEWAWLEKGENWVIAGEHKATWPEKMVRKLESVRKHAQGRVESLLCKGHRIINNDSWRFLMLQSQDEVKADIFLASDALGCYTCGRPDTVGICDNCTQYTTTPWDRRRNVFMLLGSSHSINISIRLVGARAGKRCERYKTETLLDMEASDKAIRWRRVKWEDKGQWYTTPICTDHGGRRVYRGEIQCAKRWYSPDTDSLH